MAYCNEYLELISAAIDGALSPTEQEKLSAHLSSCQECQRLYDDLSALHAAMAGLPPAEEVPAELKGRIMDAVAAEAEEAKAPPFAPKKSTVRWQRWLASAAVLALVVLGTWSWKPWESRSSDAPQSVNAVAGAADRGRGADTTEAQPAAPAAMPEPASAPAESAPAVTPRLASAFTAGDAASVPENATADAPAEASLTTEATGPLDYEPMAKVAPAAGAALPSEAPVGTDMEIAPIMMMSNGFPIEEAGTVGMTAKEALDRLLEEYPKPGCENWEYGEIEPGWQSPEWITTDGSPAWLAYYGPREDKGQIFCYNFDTWGFLDGELMCAATFVIPVDGGEILIAGP